VDSAHWAGWLAGSCPRLRLPAAAVGPAPQLQLTLSSQQSTVNHLAPSAGRAKAPKDRQDPHVHTEIHTLHSFNKHLTPHLRGSDTCVSLEQTPIGIYFLLPPPLLLLRSMIAPREHTTCARPRHRSNTTLSISRLLASRPPARATHQGPEVLAPCGRSSGREKGKGGGGGSEEGGRAGERVRGKERGRGRMVSCFHVIPSSSMSSASMLFLRPACAATY
jgi:hypothetical protein